VKPLIPENILQKNCKKINNRYAHLEYLNMKKLIDFTVTENKRLNHDTILLVLHSDELPEIQPGQFVNVRVDHSPSTFLRRPISVHDVDESRRLLYLFIKIVGCGTSTLGELQIGDKVNVMLPLGNHFSIPTSGRPLLIGGGCGVAPMLHLSRIMKAQGLSPVVLIGTRTDKDILRKEEYEKYATVYYTTEDGSFGEKGYVTQHSVLKEKFDHIFCCGPEVMMKAVAGYANQNKINCEVSLENTMACGIGACLCCVTDTKEGHKCVCTEGPIFNIKDLKWQI
jgi:dihydroorotate dehydrogenase, electron transfer subunit